MRTCVGVCMYVRVRADNCNRSHSALLVFCFFVNFFHCSRYVVSFFVSILCLQKDFFLCCPFQTLGETSDDLSCEKWVVFFVLSWHV